MAMLLYVFDLVTDRLYRKIGLSNSRGSVKEIYLINFVTVTSISADILEMKQFLGSSFKLFYIK